MNDTKDLSAVLIECSFPSRYDWLAKASLHLTPKLLGAELKRLRADVPVLVTHIKPEDAPCSGGQLVSTPLFLRAGGRGF